MECAACASECTAGAIYLDCELPPGAKQFAAVNADYFEGKSQA
jgi:ferredoxin